MKEARRRAARYALVVAVIVATNVGAAELSMDPSAGYALRAEILVRVAAMWLPTLFAATFLVPLALALRIGVRARVKRGGVDWLARLGERLRARPTLKRLLIALPAALIALIGLVVEVPHVPGPALGVVTAIAAMLLPSLVFAGGLAFLARAYSNKLTAPVLRSNERVEPSDERADGMYFNAVAVTGEARAAVAAFTLAILLGVVAVGVGQLPTLLGSVVGFGGASALFIAGFSRASKIAIGVDGVRIFGTSRTRFFAFKDIDAVVDRWGDVVLRRGSKDLVRLQLHGASASRKDAIIARITAGIDGAREVADDRAHRLVAAASKSELVQAARGGSDYRSRGADRDELWEIVESPATDATARGAAASALVRGASPADRTRLRVAAEHCADPDAKRALLRIAPEGEDDERDDDEPIAVSARRREAL